MRLAFPAGARGTAALLLAAATLLTGCVRSSQPARVGRTGSPTSPALPSPSPSPPAFEAARFAVKGDWGWPGPAQRAVTGRMCEVRAAQPFATVVTTGDNFYRPDGTATAGTFEEPEACLLGWPGHRWRAAWGNHDLAGRSTADLLGATEPWYSWSEGSAEFFVLDSSRPGDPQQVHWLEQALAASTAKVRIAVIHAPPYTVGSGHQSDEAVRQHLVPLFRRYGIDLVLSGHNHLYEHSLFEGIHYVVSGGGGAPLYRCERRDVWLLRCDAIHHFLLVEVAGWTVTVTAITSEGRMLDRFSFEAR